MNEMSYQIYFKSLVITITNTSDTLQRTQGSSVKLLPPRRYLNIKNHV